MLHDVWTTAATPLPIRAERVDGEGRVIASNDSGLPFSALPDSAVAGGEGGFMLVRQSSGPEPRAITAYVLDPVGIDRSGSVVLQASQNAVAITPAYITPPVVIWDGARYLTAWRTETVGSDTSVEWVAEISPNGSAAVARGGESAAPGFGVAIASNGEVDSDGAQHGYIRRFSMEGVSQDETPIEVMTVSSGFPVTAVRIVATTDVYILGWPTLAGFAVRRLDAGSGRWIDPNPIRLGQTVSDLATNGVDALAASLESCGMGVACVTTTRIPGNGSIPGPRVVSLRASGSTASSLALASNGTDYLFAWANVSYCAFECPEPPRGQAYAVRLRADGTAIDAQPLELDSGKNAPGAITATFADSAYLVVWPDVGLRAVRVTPEGAVLDRDAEGNATTFGETLDPVHAASVGGQYVLIGARQSYLDNSTFGEVTWQGVTFSPNTPLDQVASMPRTPLFASPFRPYQDLAAAGSGSAALVIAYSRGGGAEVGNVSRVMSRVFANFGGKRRAERQP